MYRIILVLLVAAFSTCSFQNNAESELAAKILADENLQQVLDWRLSFSGLLA